MLILIVSILENITFLSLNNCSLDVVVNDLSISKSIA